MIQAGRLTAPLTSNVRVYMQLVSTCIKCGQTIDADNGDCTNCSNGYIRAETDNTLTFKKLIKQPIIKYPSIILIFLIVLGFAVQFVLPDCRCSLEGCNGCGGAIGNFLGRFSNGCIILFLMGSVLLMWFGIPILILWVIVSGVFGLLKKVNKNE